MTKEQALDRLIEMSHWLGEECRGFAILGEGNTSARVDSDSFLVKASGSQLGTITPDGIVQVGFRQALSMLDGPTLSDSEIKTRLLEATIDNPRGLCPSIETLFHAYLLSIPGVNFVGHSHPVSVNAITCSKSWKEVTSNRLFPDEIICCGVAPVHVRYSDPGVTLAAKIKEAVEERIFSSGERPKAVLIQNHGLIAIGSTDSEVKSITAMWDKTAKVLAGTFLFGGPNYLSHTDVDRINTRPDEEIRKNKIEGKNPE